MADWAIIGAGAGGLAAGRALRRDGLPFVIYERHHDVGGIWDVERPGTPINTSTHFISSRTRSALEGLPFPEDTPDYPDHRRVLAYLRDYADRYGLRPHIRLRTTVERAEPTASGWSLKLTGPRGSERRTHRGAILASGSQWRPRLPVYPGEWRGEAYHARDYREPRQFDGRRVLVVGAGNSGCDIACDAALVADHAAISTRRGYWIVPKHIMGQPTDVFAHRLPPMPGRLRQKAFQGLLRVVVGDLSSYGWRAPDHPVLASHPIVNSRILDHLRNRDLVQRPDIAALEGDRVRFVDGSREAFDTIVWATGYRLEFPYLADDVLPWPRDNDPGLFLNTFHRTRDDVFALGYVETDGGAWPHISLQADLIAQVISDLDERPEQAAAFRRLKRSDPDLSGGIEHVSSPRHAYYVQDDAFRHFARQLLHRLRAGRLAADGLGRRRLLAR